MTEQNTEPTVSDDSTGGGKDTSSGLLIGGSILAVIVVVGIIISLVIAFRGGDEPLVPAGDSGSNGSNAIEQETDRFEPDPFFDEMGRVVYVPLDAHGVALEQTLPAGGRAATTPPSGVMLERVHDNMIVPFSASDGPTKFTENGVAKGFSRSPQGAVLAAAHYSGYLAAGNDRIDMLRSAGLVDDVNGVVADQITFNDSGRPGAIPAGFPYRVFPMIKVDYTPDLARVHFGITANMKNGSTQNVEGWADLVWRDGIGWIVKVRGKDTLGVSVVEDFSEGWTSWW